MLKRSRFHDGKSGSALAIKITPNSDFTELTEITEDGTLLITLASAQAWGDANTALINFLCLMAGISKDQIEIIAGEDGPDKLVAILFVNPDELHKKIMDYWHKT